jgi:linoleoyl-CoA desaturase
MEKVTFENGGAFIRDTRREVEAYLAGRGTQARGAVRLYAKAPVALGLTAGPWAVLVFVHPGLAGGLLCLLALAVGVTLVGFCIQHDANHGAYFRSRRWNHVLGWSTDALL